MPQNSLFLEKDNARQARIRMTDAIIKAKAREQRQIDLVTAYLCTEIRERNLALIGEEAGKGRSKKKTTVKESKSGTRV